MSILDKIFAHKRLEVAAAQEHRPAASLEAALTGLPLPAGFAAAIGRSAPGCAPELIAEVKHRSPSKGILRAPFDPLELARLYARNGAAAISVLTDEKYFGGSLEILSQIARLDLGLPLLRKDFIFHRYQLLEARLAGASAVLLILAMLTPADLRSLLAEAHALGLEALVETHTAAEVARALEAGARIIGVNNRDLATFEVRLETCLELRPLIPAEVVMVAESGIRTAADVSRLAAAGVDAILVGEGLVTAADVGAKVREFVEQP
jgi:indole-3-glycerol phosphate synthase